MVYNMLTKLFGLIFATWILCFGFFIVVAPVHFALKMLGLL